MNFAIQDFLDYVYFVTNWNGRELYGILGDGLPPMQHTYMNKR